MAILSPFVSFLLLPILSQAHMQMSWPYPINSPLDPQTPPEQKDYDYTSPLLPGGSNFPCKGYQHATPLRTTAEYQAGRPYNMTITGGAQHGGGSCQLSLSYDNGVTFKVIKSMIGGCPITLEYDFTIPDFAPSGSALFAWTWFNLMGNREMYMNCAQVQIVGSSLGRHRRSQYKRQQSMDSLPNIFVANVNQPDQCASIAGEDVIFPNPGNDVVHGTDSIPHSQPDAGYSCHDSMSGLNPSGLTNSFTITSSTSAPMVTPTSTLSLNASSTTTALFLNSTATAYLTLGTSECAPMSSGDTTMTTTMFVTSTTSQVVTVTAPSTLSSSPLSVSATSNPSSFTTSSLLLPSVTAIPGTCSPGSFTCNSATTFSMCSGKGTGFIFMGSVAAGMTCENGSIIRINDGPCTPNGSIQCGSTGLFFFECDQGGLINMGPTAAGTRCVDGQIVAA